MTVGAGMDRITGRPLAGWPHTVQCIGVIFTTFFGSRVLRRWFGSLVPAMLGQNLVAPTLLAFFTSIYAALEFEPRFALTKIDILSTADELRAGRLKMQLQGQYRPRAHLGDYTVEGPRRVMISGTDGTRFVATEVGA